jgi:signal transduction histidine kinase
MNRSRILPALVSLSAVLLIAADGSVKNHLPRTATRDALMTYVRDAAAVVQKHGPSCDTFAKPEWRSNDYYIFVSGPDNTTLCHPNAAIVGKSTADIVNKNGEQVGAKISKMAEANGSGWVEYMWAPRAGAAEEMKSTYVMGVTGADGKHYIVGSGAFRMSK